jgi:transcriptional regulator with XRE-family HTH domain
MSHPKSEPATARAWLAHELEVLLAQPGMTQREIATRAGRMSSQTISDYLKQARPVSMDKARAIVARINAPALSVSDLVTRAQSDCAARLDQLRAELETLHAAGSARVVTSDEARALVGSSPAKRRRQ